MKTERIVVLPGDGIGPEVTNVALNVLKEICRCHRVKIETTEFKMGGASLDKYGEPITDQALDACKEAKAVLLGSVGGPAWNDYPPKKRPEAALLKLRAELGVFANLRPVKVQAALANASTLKPHIIDQVDILIVRELTGGIYFGDPRYTKSGDEGEYAVDTMKYTEPEVERLLQKGFEAATKRRGRLHSVHKSNVLDSSRLWEKVTDKVADEWPDIELRHMLVDNCAMQLVRNPAQFDVIVAGNLFGDILSDEAAMLTGSIGMLPSASLGEGTSLYEPVHGTAPDIAGQGKANPIAAIKSAALMCRYALDMEEAAREIENAIDATIAAGYRTADIYTGHTDEYQVSTTGMGEAVLKHLFPNLQPGAII